MDALSVPVRRPRGSRWWWRAALAALAAAAVVGVLSRPTSLPAVPVSGTGPAATARPLITFPSDLAARVGSDRSTSLKVPAGLRLGLDAEFQGTDDEGRVVTATVPLAREGDVVQLGLPTEFAAGTGRFTLTVTGSTAWPDWSFGELDVAVSTDPAAGFPAGPVTVTGSGTITTDAFTARPGALTTTPLPDVDALRQAADEHGEVKAALVEAATTGTAAPTSTPFLADLDGDAVTFTLPADVPVDAYPADRAVPDLHLSWAGTGGLSRVEVVGPLAVTRRVADRPGLARATDGALEFLFPESDAPGTTVRTVRFGLAGDVPLMGDWDGDGKESPGSYRPSTGEFRLGGGPTLVTIALGRPGDLPVTGDFTGAGKDSVAVFRPSAAAFFLADGTQAGFGAPGDLPLAGRWHDPAGPDLIGVYRPSTHTFLLASANVTGGGTVVSRPFGGAGDVPFTGDFDGDGTDDPGLRHPSSATFELGASMGALDPRTTLVLGRPGDQVFSWSSAGAGPNG